MKLPTLSLLALGLFTAGSTQAFELVSQDIQEGHPMAKTFEYQGWG
ncbi:YbhB/YbcL family Raf kinase inhibitor-like protein, partial [Vibrio fortis]